MALIVVMFMTVILGMMVTMLHATVRDEMAIAGNRRRHFAAKQAATSGINHFQSMNLHHHDIKRLIGEEPVIEVIPATKIGKAWYKVRAQLAAEEIPFQSLAKGL
jgi:hypothetical protein